MPRSDLRRVVDVVDREGDARMPISLGRVGSVSIASGWMYSNSDATVAVRGLVLGDVGVVCVVADGIVGPLPADGVTADQGGSRG